MKHPEKWRETADPFSLPIKKFKITKVLGYPHAGNDVFYVLGEYEGEVEHAFIKVARQKGANIEREVKVINSINFDFLPEILDYSDDFSVVVTREIEGERLTSIVGDDMKKSLEYMGEFGETLAKLHETQTFSSPQIDRKFHHIPSDEVLEELRINNLKKWLQDNQPTKTNLCFCHGDFHYANILWDNGHVSGVLDFELSGIGNREFDIAWSLIRRPTQKFMKSEREMKEYLKGYSKHGVYDDFLVKYYMVQIYCYFYQLGRNNPEYQAYVKEWIKNIINE